MRNSGGTRNPLLPGIAWLPVALVALICWAVFAQRALSAQATDPGTSTKPPAAATLEECTTSRQEAERAATFSGEMSAIPGTAKMEMRIDILERSPKDAAFHPIVAAGLGVWRGSAPGVKTFKYLKQVTNLPAPAYYRGSVRFRWLGGKGKLIRTSELRTARCLQTVPSTVEPPSGEGVPAKTA